MSIFDGLLRSIAGSPDDVVNLAEKVGISPQMAEMAISALGRAHQAPGDTVSTAATETGLDASVLTSIVGHIGGEGSLGNFASMLDRDGDGNPLNDLGGLMDTAKGLLGR